MGRGAKGFSVVCCATAESQADRNIRIAIQRMNVRAIKLSPRRNRLRKVARRQLIICVVLREPFAHHLLDRISQLHGRQIAFAHPFYIADVGSCRGLSRNLAAQIINQNVVILCVAIAVGEDAVEDVQHLARLDGSPVSSRTSRRTPSRSFSPSSSTPPGTDHSPLSGSVARRTSSTRPSSTITAPTPMMGCSG